MAEISTGPSPLQRIQRTDFLLGLCMPVQDGGWTPSTAEREAQWSFGCNARLAKLAERFGFDLAFALAQPIGDGGQARTQDLSTAALMPTAGFASATERMLLISTIHVLYGQQPLHIARFGAALDAMTGGRWGINVVTGYRKPGCAKFGIDMPEHDRRYEMAEDFASVVGGLWHGGHAPVIASAGNSAAAIDFAARRSDMMFVAFPEGADMAQSIATLGSQVARIKEQAARYGRQIRCIVSPHVVCRDTERESQAYLQRILDGADDETIDVFIASIVGGETRGERSASGWTADGKVQIAGSPEQVVDWMLKLKAVGCDGVQINFFDFEPDLQHFGERVLPLMRQAGLRNG